jgi:hypothetical protein
LKPASTRSCRRVRQEHRDRANRISTIALAEDQALGKPGTRLAAPDWTGAAMGYFNSKLLTPFSPASNRRDLFHRQHRGDDADRLFDEAAQTLTALVPHQNDAVGADDHGAAIRHRRAAHQAQFRSGFDQRPVLTEIHGFESMAAQAECKHMIAAIAEHAEHRAVVRQLLARPGRTLIARAERARARRR